MLLPLSPDALCQHGFRSMDDVPPPEWVYLLYQKGIVMYVGRSFNVWQRVFQHQHGRSGIQRIRFDEVLMRPYPKAEARAMERFFIYALQPHGNTRFKDRRPPEAVLRVAARYGFTI